MAIFMSEKRSQTGGKNQISSVLLTCGSYFELEALRDKCQQAGVRASWSVPDLEDPKQVIHNSRVRTEVRCRVDRMEHLRKVAKKMYSTEHCIIEIPEALYEAQIHRLRKEVWSMCCELEEKDRRRLQEEYWTPKTRWNLGQWHRAKAEFRSAVEWLGEDCDEEALDDLKNLIDQIENLDLGHCLRLNRGVTQQNYERKRLETD